MPTNYPIMKAHQVTNLVNTISNCIGIDIGIKLSELFNIVKVLNQLVLIKNKEDAYPMFQGVCTARKIVFFLISFPEMITFKYMLL